MRVIDPGHRFALRMLDGDGEIYLQFVQREGEGYPGNVNSYPGTTSQEVLRAVISRTKYVDKQIPDGMNLRAIYHLRQAIRCFEVRAADRHGRILEADFFDVDIEDRPTCPKCMHIGCPGTCH